MTLVAISVKDCLSTVPAGHHMIDCIGIFDVEVVVPLPRPSRQRWTRKQQTGSDAKPIAI